MTRLVSRIGRVNAIHRAPPLTRDALACYVPCVFSIKNMHHAAVASIAVNNGVTLWTGHVQ